MESAFQNLIQGFSYSYGLYNYLMAAFGTVLGIPQEEVVDFIVSEVEKAERGEV